MPPVQLRLHGHLNALAGAILNEREPLEGETALEWLTRWQSAHDKAGLLFDEQGRLLSGVVVAVNGVIIAPDDLRSLDLSGGEKIDIIPDLSGG